MFCAARTTSLLSVGLSHVSPTACTIPTESDRVARDRYRARTDCLQVLHEPSPCREVDLPFLRRRVEPKRVRCRPRVCQRRPPRVISSEEQILRELDAASPAGPVLRRERSPTNQYFPISAGLSRARSIESHRKPGCTTRPDDPSARCAVGDGVADRYSRLLRRIPTAVFPSSSMKIDFG